MCEYGQASAPAAKRYVRPQEENEEGRSRDIVVINRVQLSRPSACQHNECRRQVESERTITEWHPGPRSRSHCPRSCHSHVSSPITHQASNSIDLACSIRDLLNALNLFPANTRGGRNSQSPTYRRRCRNPARVSIEQVEPKAHSSVIEERTKIVEPGVCSRQSRLHFCPLRLESSARATMPIRAGKRACG